MLARGFMEFRQETYHRSKPYGIWDVDWSDGKNYVKGSVATPYGFVLAYSERLAHSHTHLRFIYRGNEYFRKWNKNYSQTYIVTLANRFAASVVEGS